jgi:hypothetical protein
MHSRPAVFSDKGSGVVSSDFTTLLQLNRRLAYLESKLSGGTDGIVGDAFLDRWSAASNPNPGEIKKGTVVLSVPFLHAYLVKAGDREPLLLCTAAASGASQPIGVRSGDVIHTGSSVLVYHSPSDYLGYILSTIPEPALYLPDQVQQGSRSSIRKDPAYRAIVDSSTGGLGITPQISGRPLDSRQGEHVMLAESGIGLFIDSFQAFLRVNEICGLFLNYFDNYTKLAGANLDLLSYATHRQDRLDEGELSGFSGHIIYPHEAAGVYDRRTNGFQQHGTEIVQLDDSFAGAELEPQHCDQSPIYRIQEYTGYLGHGYKRFVVKPAKTSGTRRMSDAGESQDVGLFMESLSLDGAYGIRSAKSIMLSKHPSVPVPTRKRDSGDHQGDTAVRADDENRYAFSGIQEDAVVHKAQEWKAAPDDNYGGLQWVADTDGREAHFFNWKSVFPFAYHEKDFELPEDGQEESLAGVQYVTGTYQQSYVAPQPVELDVDERYGKTFFYKLASHLHFTDDGGIILSDGYGSRIVMSGGQIRTESSGDTIFMSAARIVSMGKDVITRAESNVDISAANQDVRIKAERNMQMLAGNSGSGGMLFESKGTGLFHDYANKLGNEVNATGITFLSKGGGVNLVGKQLYLRSGVDERGAAGTGDIVLDSARGFSDIQYYGRTHSFFAAQGFSIFHGLSGDDSKTPTGFTYFSAGGSILAGSVSIEKSVIIRDGSLWTSGSVISGGDIQTTGRMGCRNGAQGLGDTSKTNLNSLITETKTSAEKSAETNKQIGRDAFSGFLSSYYAAGRIGFSTLLDNQLGFSFRDTSLREESSGTYGYSPGGFKLLETRWQQLDRLGATSTPRQPWNEPTVMYQGQEQQPWPGLLNWSNNDSPAFLSYDQTAAEPGLFDYSQGLSADREQRREDYESPELLPWSAVKTCSENFKI